MSGWPGEAKRRARAALDADAERARRAKEEAGASMSEVERRLNARLLKEARKAGR